MIEEARAAVPRPPSPDINALRGWMGIEYSSIITRNSPGSTSSEIGLVARVQMTRIGGTYWDFNGYGHGRFTTISGPAAPATISDLINRTYTLSLTYNNPGSRLVAGAGRLYLPWATSLDTIDGGYVGRRMNERTIRGSFRRIYTRSDVLRLQPQRKAGGSVRERIRRLVRGLALLDDGWFCRSAPSGGMPPVISGFWRLPFPTSTCSPYMMRRRLICRIRWRQLPPAPAARHPPRRTTSTGGLNRSYITVRFQPNSHVEFDLNDTYYRDFPTFDPQLIATGLLDRYLFQGLSGGVRVNLPEKISVYTDLGQSSASGDAQGSWNQMYGITFGEIWRTGVHADLRYTKYNSSFGSGDYKAISLSRSMGDRLEWQLIGGAQNLNSTLTSTSQTHFISTYLNLSAGKLMFFQAGYTWQRGGTMNYDQFEFTVGKRFGGSRR